MEREIRAQKTRTRGPGCCGAMLNQNGNQQGMNTPVPWRARICIRRDSDWFNMFPSNLPPGEKSIRSGGAAGLSLISAFSMCPGLL